MEKRMEWLKSFLYREGNITFVEIPFVLLIIKAVFLFLCQLIMIPVDVACRESRFFFILSFSEQCSKVCS